MADPKEEMPVDEDVAVDAAEAMDPPAFDPANDDLMDLPDQSTSEDVDQLRAERDEMRDRWMRALAEAENVRKRADRDRREAEQYGGKRIARDLLPVFDNLDRALNAVTEEQRAAAGALIEGVELTQKELMAVFARHGVTVIAPEVGDKFDPENHEAMFEAPVPGTVKGHIIQVSAVGFSLHGRLLRPAQVGVSSMPAS